MCLVWFFEKIQGIYDKLLHYSFFVAIEWSKIMILSTEKELKKINSEDYFKLTSGTN